MAFGLADILLLVLQCYFILMNLTVERFYCQGPLLPNDTRFLVKETIDFCKLHNRVFLNRPDWIVTATCISAYVLCCGYLCILLVTLTNSWKRFAVPLLLFIGAKMNAILYYHIMEFTSSTPPENLVPYFSVEGPYLVSITLVVYKVYSSLNSEEKAKSKKK